MNKEIDLLRQVEPHHIQDGEVTSLAFRPRPNIDKALLSVYDGSLIDPPKAYHHFNSLADCISVGTLAVKVEECESLDLECRNDPEEFPEHAVIDYLNTSKGVQKKRSAALRDMAQKRGWILGPFPHEREEE